MSNEMVWVGDDDVLPIGSRVILLATDEEDPSVTARRACWVRYWPAKRDFPMYRSCDLSDLATVDVQPNDEGEGK